MVRKRRLILNNSIDVIIAREPVLGKPDGLSIVFQNRDPIVIPISIWVSRGLSIQEEVTSDLITQLERDSAIYQVRPMVLRYLSPKPRTEREVRTYLQRKQVTTGTSNDVIFWLMQQNLINDFDYCVSYVKSHETKMSRTELKSKLQIRGVSSQTIEQAIREIYSDFSEQHALEQLARKKWKTLVNQSQEVASQRLGAYLQRKGFSYQMIFQVIGELERPSND